MKALAPMKAKLVLLISVLFSTLTFAATSVQISEVGLKGYYSVFAPTPVRVSVDVPPDVDSLTLDFKIFVGEEEKLGPLQVDRFSKQVVVHGGEQTRTVVPLQLPAVNHSRLELDVRTRDGRPIGNSTISLTSLTRVFSDSLVAMVCQDHRDCDEVQSQISFSGSEGEVLEKDKTFKFVALETPRQQWLDYAVAKFVVVATPLSSWTTEQRFALEAYARQGGTLLLVEKEADDESFLAPYRLGDLNKRITLGRGDLYRVSSLASKELAALFSGKRLKENNQPARPTYGGPADPFRAVAATAFYFPRLRWLLFWLSAYILIAGVGNFALLRWLRRLEWGWITTSTIAVIFAIGLYFASSSHRPKEVTLDDLAVYWMDSQSPQAWETIGLRVSSPERQQLGVAVGEDAILTSGGAQNAASADVDIASEITRERRLRPGLDVRLGPPVAVELSLLRWSFADVDFQTFHTFPGTVTLSSDLHLKNETGQRFRDSIYFNFPENKKYFISGLDPGQEVDLNAISPSAIRVELRQDLGDNQVVIRVAPADSRFTGTGTFPLSDLADRLQLAGQGHAFVGLSDGPERDAAISGTKFARSHLSLMVVALDQP